jgi:hypothetical protein
VYLLSLSLSPLLLKSSHLLSSTKKTTWYSFGSLPKASLHFFIGVSVWKSSLCLSSNGGGGIRSSSGGGDSKHFMPLFPPFFFLSGKAMNFL